jgi:hypothetical protein
MGSATGKVIGTAGCAVFVVRRHRNVHIVLIADGHHLSERGFPRSSSPQSSYLFYEYFLRNVLVNCDHGLAKLKHI